MKEPMNEISICRVCGKKFKKLINRRTYGSGSRAKRNFKIKSRNRVTCSKECSREYTINWQYYNKDGN